MAAALAELIGTEASPALAFSTDQLREVLFGDAATRGAWSDVEAQLHQRLREALAAGDPPKVGSAGAGGMDRLWLRTPQTCKSPHLLIPSSPHPRNS